MILVAFICWMDDIGDCKGLCCIDSHRNRLCSSKKGIGFNKCNISNILQISRNTGMTVNCMVLFKTLFYMWHWKYFGIYIFAQPLQFDINAAIISPKITVYFIICQFCRFVHTKIAIFTPMHVMYKCIVGV